MVGVIGVNMFLNQSFNFISDNIVNFVLSKLLPRLFELIMAPFGQPEMLWIVSPLIIAMILMQAYFSRHRQEELGWNTAFGSSISLIFVFVNLFQKMYLDYGFNLFTNPKIYFIGLLTLLTIMQLILNFFHKWPKKFAFFLGSAFFVNTLAYFSIIFIYTNIPLDYTSLFASIILFFLVFASFKILNYIVPMSKGAKVFIAKKKKKEEQRKYEKEIYNDAQQRLKEAKVKNALKSAGIFISLAIAISFAIEITLKFVDLPFILAFVPVLQGAVFIPFIRKMLKKEEITIFNLNFDMKGSGPIIGTLIGLITFGLISLLNRGILLFAGSEQLNLILNSNLLYNNALSNIFFLIIFSIGTVIIVPITDEIVFRGLILRDLREKFSVKSAIFIQALFFTVRCFDFYTLSLSYGPFALLRFIIPFVCGIIFGVLKEKVNLETAIFAHITINILGAVIFFFK